MPSTEKKELPENGTLRGLFRFENGISSIVLLLVALLPASEIIARKIFNTGFLETVSVIHGF